MSFNVLLSVNKSGASIIETRKIRPMLHISRRYLLHHALLYFAALAAAAPATAPDSRPAAALHRSPAQRAAVLLPHPPPPAAVAAWASHGGCCRWVQALVTPRRRRPGAAPAPPPPHDWRQRDRENIGREKLAACRACRLHGLKRPSNVSCMAQLTITQPALVSHAPRPSHLSPQAAPTAVPRSCWAWRAAAGRRVWLWGRRCASS